MSQASKYLIVAGLGFSLASAIWAYIDCRWRANYQAAEFDALLYRRQRNDARRDAEKCWERFYRAHPSDRAGGGE